MWWTEVIEGLIGKKKEKTISEMAKNKKIWR